MTMYWVYDLPNWLFAALTVTVFVAIGLLGLYPTRRWVKRHHHGDQNHNDIVGFYLAAVTVFYGITLGLLAVGAWTTYSDVQAKVDREAEALGSLYRDVGGLPDPYRTELRGDLRDYAHYVIDVSWPQQRQGIVPSGSGIYLDRVENHLLAFQPGTMGQQVILAEAYRQFNDLIEDRRARLNAVPVGMPSSLWALVIIGALVTIAVTLFFDIASFSMHFWMTGLLSGLLGLMIFLIGTLDNPFRGKVSIGPEAIVRVYNRLIAPTTDAIPLPEKKD